VRPLVAALVALLAGAGTGTIAPSDLLTADVPAGFEPAAEPPVDLTFEEYAPLSPEAIAHVDPDSTAALAMRAAVDVWTSGDDDILLREVTRWADEDDARAFVEQAVVMGIRDGLTATDAPFEGGIAFSGVEEGLWTRTLAWRQGPYGVTVSHFTIGDDSDAVITQAARALADRITAGTDHRIAADGASAETPAPGSSGDGVPIATVLFWLVLAGGVIWLVVTIRRRRAEPRTAPTSRDRTDGAGGTTRAEARDLDDIIERARARGRAERDVDAIPDPSGDRAGPNEA
jgi:hypothetical protein